MSDKTLATAKVSVLLEVNCIQPWPNDSTIEEIRKAATIEAETILTRIANHHSQKLRITGPLKVTAILVPADEYP